jgi:hypothetical protein
MLWLDIFCIARIVCRRDVLSMIRYCGSSSISGIKRKISCIVRKGEKQIQILDGSQMSISMVAVMLGIYI